MMKATTNQKGENKMMAFKAGQKLSARSIGDHNCVFTATVLKRTEKTITLDVEMEGTKRIKIHNQEEGEFCYPFGQYSMAPRFKAFK